ncbi:reverse transcriptase family protein [Haloferula chungangensis]|uniref:RNA-directed DNA polymerase n=1 Tax=Haloferula chungangensis TaxID=1048331 RepID=A0ABW2L8Q2_9BACT
MPGQAHHIKLLASALAAGSLNDAQAMFARTRPLVGDLRKAPWLKPLTRALAGEFGSSPRPPKQQVADYIRAYPAYCRAWASGRGRMATAFVETQMAPAAGAPEGWKVPEITTLRQLAHCLRLHPDDLQWLTAHASTDHYHRSWHAKPGSGNLRLIEAPKTLLRFAQRKILQQILEAIPPHEAATGFSKGKSVRDHVHPHTEKAFVLRMDLEDFFPSIAAARVMKVFLTAGYPDEISRTLTRLTTCATSPTVLTGRSLRHSVRQRFSHAHLPQGAPSSPALANLSAFRLDCRLAGLARTAGAVYSRYADDLLFSGDLSFSRQATSFQATVGAIVIEEGFIPNHRKTRGMPSSQRQKAAGLVLNSKPNIDRRDYDRLKAILNNCARHGPASQNRDALPDFSAHLRGRIEWVRSVNSSRGEKLQQIFDRIDWPE